MPDPDDKQVDRRQSIESEAWRLVAERGYDGVTMRELARRAGLSTRTLYEMYGGKDALLGEAFRERLRVLFDRFEEAIASTGIAHLGDLCEAITASIVSGENFSRAYASVLASNKLSVYSIPTPVIHFRRCLEEARAQGQLVAWCDLDFTARRLLLGQHSLMIQWGSGVISSANLNSFYGLSMCEILSPLSLGEAQRSLVERLRGLHLRLKSLERF